MSFRKTPSIMSFLLAVTDGNVEEEMRLHWLLALILVDCIIVGRIGKDLGRMFRGENIIFPLESCVEVFDAGFWTPAALFMVERCLNCSGPGG
jgi:hypothetical protein